MFCTMDELDQVEPILVLPSKKPTIAPVLEGYYMALCYRQSRPFTNRYDVRSSNNRHKFSRKDHNRRVEIEKKRRIRVKRSIHNSVIETLAEPSGPKSTDIDSLPEGTSRNGFAPLLIESVDFDRHSLAANHSSLDTEDHQMDESFETQKPPHLSSISSDSNSPSSYQQQQSAAAKSTDIDSLPEGTSRNGFAPLLIESVDFDRHSLAANHSSLDTEDHQMDESFETQKPPHLSSISSDGNSPSSYQQQQSAAAKSTDIDSLPEGTSRNGFAPLLIESVDFDRHSLAANHSSLDTEDHQMTESFETQNPPHFSSISSDSNSPSSYQQQQSAAAKSSGQEENEMHESFKNQNSPHLSIITVSDSNSSSYHQRDDGAASSSGLKANEMDDSFEKQNSPHISSITISESSSSNFQQWDGDTAPSTSHEDYEMYESFEEQNPTDFSNPLITDSSYSGQQWDYTPSSSGQEDFIDADFGVNQQYQQFYEEPSSHMSELYYIPPNVWKSYIMNYEIPPRKIEKKEMVAYLECIFTYFERTFDVPKDENVTKLLELFFYPGKFVLKMHFDLVIDILHSLSEKFLVNRDFLRNCYMGRGEDDIKTADKILAVFRLECEECGKIYVGNSGECTVQETIEKMVTPVRDLKKSRRSSCETGVHTYFEESLQILAVTTKLLLHYREAVEIEALKAKNIPLVNIDYQQISPSWRPLFKLDLSEVANSYSNYLHRGSQGDDDLQ